MLNLKIVCALRRFCVYLCFEGQSNGCLEYLCINQKFPNYSSSITKQELKIFIICMLLN